MEAGKSYSIYSSTKVKSEFLVNQIVDYLKYINELSGISSVPSIMGKHILISDTSTPSKRRAVISLVDRKSDKFTPIDISKSYVNIISELLEVEDNKAFISFCKRNLTRKPLEIVYYYMSSIATLAIQNDEFNETKASYIIEEYLYAGVHTFTDKAQALIDYIYTPTPANLQSLIHMFPDTEVVVSLRGLLSSLIQEDKYIRYVIDRNQDITSDVYFSRRALMMSAALMKCESKEELLLELISTLQE